MRTDAMFDPTTGALYTSDVTTIAAGTTLPIKQSLIPALLSYCASQALLSPAGENYNQAQSMVHFKEFESAVRG